LAGSSSARPPRPGVRPANCPTPRAGELLRLVAAGRGNRAIAVELVAVCPVRAVRRGKLPRFSNANVDGIVLISPVFASKVASTTVVSGPAGAVYDGTAKLATAQTTGAGGAVIATSAVSYAPGPGAPVNAGDYTASASFPGDDAYLPSADSRPFTIAKAASTTTVTAGDGRRSREPGSSLRTAGDPASGLVASHPNAPRGAPLRSSMHRPCMRTPRA
jgi:hypothetical protein